jgi:hypothetical protein
MIHRILALVAVAFFLLNFVLADDDPPRLKKKVKPGDENAPKKEEPKVKDKEKPKEPPRLPEKPKVGDDDDMPPPEPEIDEQEVLNRVAKDMRASEDRLGKKDLSEGTRQVQRDIVKGLDDLIKQSQNGGQQGQDDQQDQQNNQGGASQDQQKQKQQQRQKQASGAAGKRKQKGMQNQRAQREARRMQKRGQQGQAQRKPQQGDQQDQANDQQQAGNNPGGGRGGQTGEMNKIADVYKDIWGHLPETLRAEMDAYGREKFMAKYEELIKRYYDRAARESRRKGD